MLWTSQFIDTWDWIFPLLIKITNVSVWRRFDLFLFFVNVRCIYFISVLIKRLKLKK